MKIDCYDSDICDGVCINCGLNDNYEVSPVLARVVVSSMHEDFVSLRNINYRGIKKTLTNAGFKPGDEIVILNKEIYESIIKGAYNR